MSGNCEHWTLMPGAEVVEVDVNGHRARAQFGVPPCIKLWFQRRLSPPTTFVLPDRFFHRGVVQVALEFFLYYFLFAMGKAFGRLGDERLVVIGTPEQLARCRRMLEVSLFGFDEEEMRSWPQSEGSVMTEAEARFVRDCQLFLSPKKKGFEGVRDFLDRHPDPARWPRGEELDAAPLAQGGALLREFLASYEGDDPQEARRSAYASCRIRLDDAVEWRAFDDEGGTTLFPGATVHRHGNNRFSIRHAEEIVDLSVNFEQDQAPWLVTLPPAPQSVAPEVFRVLCLGSDPGFEMEHPTTGFAVCLNGSWAVIDAPVCASYLLERYGVDPADVRMVFETHGHEDHMGSGIHFMLECITTGRSYTYVAAEPVYRTCVVKVAAILGITEAEAHQMLSTRAGVSESGNTGTGGVLRVSPNQPVRLLGATWEFFWMVHPVATTGFRVQLEHAGGRHVISYSSDTAPIRGTLGLDAMRAEGFLPADLDPYAPLLRGDEDLVFFEAGGTAGDPIHFNAYDWDLLCRAHDVHPTVVFMHAHELPAPLRGYALARPGMVWTLASLAPLPPQHFVKLVKALRFFDLADDEYWLWMFLSHGRLHTYWPGATVLGEGERHDAWFIVLQGEAEVTSSEGGASRVLGVLSSSAFFGDPAPEKPGFGVRALSHLVLWRLPGEVLREFLVSNGLWAFFDRLWSDVEWLRNSQLFLGFPHQVLAGLSHRASHRNYARNEVLMRRGEAGQELFVVLEGEVEVAHREGFPPVRRGRGDLLGEYAAFVPGARRSATVRAVTDVRVLVLTREIVDAIVAGQIPLHLRLVSLLEDRGLPAPTSR